MRRVMRGSMLTIDRAKVPSPTVLRVVPVDDDYERKLRVASDILRAMSAAGFPLRASPRCDAALENQAAPKRATLRKPSRASCRGRRTDHVRREVAVRHLNAFAGR